MSDTFAGVDDNILNEEEHLKDVRQEVNLLAPQWDIFGGHLSLKKSTIEIIRQNFPLSVERQLTEVVTDWLRWNYDYEKLGKPSWKILVKAVHLMNPKLADSIAQKHQGMGNDSSRKRRRSQPQQSSAAAASEIDGVAPKAVKFRRMSNDCSSPTSEEKNVPTDPRWGTADTKFKALSEAGMSSQQGQIQAITQNEVVSSSGPPTASSPPYQEPEDNEGSSANNTTSLPEDVATGY